MFSTNNANWLLISFSKYRSLKNRKICGKRFLITFNPNATINKNDPPFYKGTKSGLCQNAKSYSPILNNSYVVWYSLYSFLKYDSYINFEVWTPIETVKYFFKYIHKSNYYHIDAVKDWNIKEECYQSDFLMEHMNALWNTIVFRGYVKSLLVR